MADLRVPYLTMSQGNFEYFVFVVDAKRLWKVVQINERDMDKEEGYQRALSPSRVNSIAKYIDGGNPIPNAILITFAEGVADQLQREDGYLTIPDRPDAAWVIDGQHRLAGAHEAELAINVLVIAFHELKLEEQIKQFVTINREAKGVPTSLYLDLLRHLPPTKTRAQLGKERAVDLSRDLRRDTASVFYNRTVIANPKKGQISLNNFVRKVAPLVTRESGKFAVYSYEEQLSIISNYFKALEHVFPYQFKEEKMRFLGTLGFGAVMNALPTVFDLSLKHHSGFRIEDAVNVLKLVEDFGFDAWDQYGTGTQAEIAAGNDLVQQLLYRLERDDQPGSLRL